MYLSLTVLAERLWRFFQTKFYCNECELEPHLGQKWYFLSLKDIWRKELRYEKKVKTCDDACVWKDLLDLLIPILVLHWLSDLHPWSETFLPFAFPNFLMAIWHLNLEIWGPIKRKHANTQQLIFCPCPSQFHQYLEIEFEGFFSFTIRVNSVISSTLYQHFL